MLLEPVAFYHFFFFFSIADGNQRPETNTLLSIGRSQVYPQIYTTNRFSKHRHTKKKPHHQNNNIIMDETLATQLLASLLPADIVALIDTHILSPQSPVQAVKRTALAQARRSADVVLPLLQPLFDRALALLAEHQGALDMLVPLAVLLATLIVLNWVRRIILWWTRLAFRAVFWAAFAALAAWVVNRGVVASARDAAVLGAKIVGYVAVLKDVWMAEYKRYEGQEASGRWDEYAATRSSSSRAFNAQARR